MARDAPSPFWFFGGLSAALACLKATTLVAWPWLWVLAPLWLPIAGGAAVVGLIVIGCLIQP